MQVSIARPQMKWQVLENDLERLLPALASHADAVERSGGSLAPDIESLAGGDLLRAGLSLDQGGLGLGLGHDGEATLRTVTVLRRLGRANLSLARLIEGHLNVLKLLDLYAAPATREMVRSRLAGGALLGIWGADGRRPVVLHRRAGGSYRLSGEKAFASGLGIVELAVVTARPESGDHESGDPESGDPESGDAPQQLVLVDATDSGRQRPEQWTAAGMRATRSGGFVLDDLEVPASRLIGAAGDYLREPHFEGGIWRYCAAHVGGAEALVEGLRQSLIAAGRADNEHQLGRLAGAAGWCEAARRMVEAAAVAVESSAGGAPAEIDAAVAQALACRELVEASCVRIMHLVERSLGVRAHVAGSRIERQRRDLGLFLRQADPDGKLTRAGRLIAASPVEVGEQW